MRNKTQLQEKVRIERYKLKIARSKKQQLAIQTFVSKTKVTIIYLFSILDIFYFY